MSNSYIYTFIRNDLSPEQRIVQIGHACYEAGKKFKDELGISNLILLHTADEDDLTNAACELDLQGLEYTIFHEPDYDTGYTAICTRPITDPKERRFFSKWELFTHIA